MKNGTVREAPACKLSFSKDFNQGFRRARALTPVRRMHGSRAILN